MTMPAINAKIQDRIYQSHYNKAKSILTNGYKLTLARNEIVSLNDLLLEDACPKLFKRLMSADFSGDSDPLLSCYSEWHKGIFKVMRDTTDGLSAASLPEQYTVETDRADVLFSWEDVPYIFQTTDGMTYGVINEDFGHSEYVGTMDIVTDINTSKNPNKVYKDLYKFRVTANGSILDVTNELVKEWPECNADNLSGCMTEQECRAVHQEVSVKYCDGYHGVLWDSINDRCTRNITYCH